MVARQAWRMLQSPNALWVHVLKSIYFPNSSFFDVRKASHPSWVWTSILQRRDLVQLGVRWNVGNGQDILIYQDKWVPTLPGFKVTSLSVTNSLLSYVYELLDHEEEWDVTKLNTCFSSEECRELQKIPIRMCSDSFIWHYDRYGNFSIKSAYLLAIHAANETDRNHDNLIISSAEWKHIWKMQVPHKVQVFLWRALLNSLPSMDNLLRRGIVQEALCPFCHLTDESIMHLLFYCPHVEPIWFGSALGLDPWQLGVGNLVEWWRYIKRVARQMHFPSLSDYCAVVC
ncbi:hypothetical protein SLEP1_g60446 [Rubroshorea leprosula]|uniref:Reverse transcriptase zinc-binding domain-containing protein n=1 Tax=Rubroshorea leprosula TaxID=152421 RepID=A0AAV5MVU1_9ROSI|nr:hypothetical protein SLEP1_g60446 [Rubroshorea leprosula]